MIRPATLLILAFATLAPAGPAHSQINHLDIHLNQQLWNRHSDHQNRGRVGPSKPHSKAERHTRPGEQSRAANRALIARVQQNMKTLERRIPQGRRISVAKNGRVVIEVAGRVDTPAIGAFASKLLKAPVDVVRAR